MWICCIKSPFSLTGIKSFGLSTWMALSASGTKQRSQFASGRLTWPLYAAVLRGNDAVFASNRQNRGHTLRYLKVWCHKTRSEWESSSRLATFKLQAMAAASVLNANVHLVYLLLGHRRWPCQGNVSPAGIQCGWNRHWLAGRTLWRLASMCAQTCCLSRWAEASKASIPRARADDWIHTQPSNRVN